MTWNELVAEPWFWPAVSGIVAAAALVGSTASWAISTYIRWRTRPEPDWLIQARAVGHPRGGNNHGFREGYSVKGSILNVGDGVAHAVHIVGEKACTAGLRAPTTRGVIPFDLSRPNHGEQYARFKVDLFP